VFEMAALIQSPTKCKVCSVVRFLKANSQIVAVYGNVMNRQNVTEWCREFSEGMTDVHGEQRSRRPSLISDELLQEIEGEIRANRRVTIRELHHIIPEVSKTTIHETVTGKLWYRKLCARRVPKMLTDDHKTKRMGSALKFLTCFAQEGDEFLDCIVTATICLNFRWTFSFCFEKSHDGTHLAFDSTLDRRCQFKHVSLK
jgi:hypothetical protein